MQIQLEKLGPSFENFWLCHCLERMSGVIAISETKLNANSCFNLNFPNYKFIRNESITYAGGVGLYNKDSLRFRLRKDLSFDLQHCEDL